MGSSPSWKSWIVRYRSSEMELLLSFAPDVEVEVVEGEGIVVFLESTERFLHGGSFARLAKAVGTGRATREVADTLVGPSTLEEVYRAIESLLHDGVLVEREVGSLDRPSGVTASEDPSESPVVRVRAEQRSTVILAESALRSAGFQVGDDADMTIAYAPDYLANELMFEEEDIPVLLVRAVGSNPWIGPLFRAGEQPCLLCLQSRLLDGRPVLRSLRGLSTWVRTPSVRPPWDQGAHRLAALGIRQVLEREVYQPKGGSSGGWVWRWPLHSSAPTRHRLDARPQCPVCGDVDLQRRRQQHPPLLESAPILPGSTSGYRTEDSAHFLARFAHVTDPLLGLVRHPQRTPPDARGPIRTFVAIPTLHRAPTTLRALASINRRPTSGKGVSDSDARASALGEAAERFSTVWRGDEARLRSSLFDLGTEGVHPDALHGFSIAQRDPDHPTKTAPPSPLPEHQPIDWVPMWSLGTGDRRCVPAGFAYFNYARPEGTARYAYCDSNGVAAGGTMADAILQGLLELIERDAVAIWWYNGLRRPALRVPTGQDPYLDQVRDVYTSQGRPLWLLDVTTDLGIPVVVAAAPRSAKRVGLRVWVSSRPERRLEAGYRGALPVGGVSTGAKKTSAFQSRHALDGSGIAARPRGRDRHDRGCVGLV